IVLLAIGTAGAGYPLLLGRDELGGGYVSKFRKSPELLDDLFSVARMYRRVAIPVYHESRYEADTGRCPPGGLTRHGLWAGARAPSEHRCCFQRGISCPIHHSGNNPAGSKHGSVTERQHVGHGCASRYPSQVDARALDGVVGNDVANQS